MIPRKIGRSAGSKSKAKEIVARLKELKLRTAAELVEQKVDETMTYYGRRHVRCRTDYFGSAE